jgi:ParB family transcriptional regulator, chromosome partitioning protein
MQIESLAQRTALGPVTAIEISSIRHGRLNIRTNLGDLSELKQSIIEKGLLSPILVRSTEMAFSFELVVGARRLEAMRQLGFEKIDSVVCELDDKSIFEVFLVENIQRQTLSPLEEARAFYAYLGSRKGKFAYGRISELARKIGKSQEYISNRLRLLRLPEGLLTELFSQKNFMVSHAEELASLSEDQGKVKELSDLLLSQKMTVRDMERAIPLIKCGLDTKRAVDLARTEYELRIDRNHARATSDLRETLLRRSKLVLESVLSYIDNVATDLESDEELYDRWIKDVRLRVHDAIDGIIKFKKLCKKKNTAQEINETDLVGSRF